MKKVQWPVHGNRDAFQRAIALRLASGGTMIVSAAILASTVHHRLIAPVLPLTCGLLMILILWSHSQAQRIARRTEVVRSFAGLAVSHQGHVVRVSPSGAFLGEFESRRDAARAAMDHGRWAVIVHAWGRFYALAGTLQRPMASGTPVSFRTAAVADLVPSMIDDAISA